MQKECFRPPTHPTYDNTTTVVIPAATAAYKNAQRLGVLLFAVAAWPPVLLFAPSCRRSSFFERPPCRRPRRLASSDEEVQPYQARTSLPHRPFCLFDALL